MEKINNKLKPIYLGFVAIILLIISFESFAVEAKEDTSKNPRSEVWRDINSGISGRTQILGDEQGVLINKSGQGFRKSKEAQREIYKWAIPTTLLLIILFDVIFGPLRLSHKSKKKILRFTKPQIFIHTIAVISFILLFFTGICLILGRVVIEPIIGDTYASLARIAKLIHNYVGLIFFVSVIGIVILFFKNNLFKSYDINWLKKAGGMLSRRATPPKAGKFNAAEKIWYWSLTTFGLFGIGVTGIILCFPEWGTTRDTMQLMNIIHVFSALYISAFTMGHIYLGIRGVEGSLEGIKTGYVDEEWAKEHHIIWYDELKEKERKLTEKE